jgi:hypothetical protein
VMCMWCDVPVLSEIVGQYVMCMWCE